MARLGDSTQWPYGLMLLLPCFDKTITLDQSVQFLCIYICATTAWVAAERPDLVPEASVHHQRPGKTGEPSRQTCACSFPDSRVLNSDWAPVKLPAAHQAGACTLTSGGGSSARCVYIFHFLFRCLQVVRAPYLTSHLRNEPVRDVSIWNTSLCPFLEESEFVTCAPHLCRVSREKSGPIKSDVSLQEPHGEKKCWQLVCAPTSSETAQEGSSLMAHETKKSLPGHLCSYIFVRPSIHSRRVYCSVRKKERPRLLFRIWRAKCACCRCWRSVLNSSLRGSLDFRDDSKVLTQSGSYRRSHWKKCQSLSSHSDSGRIIPAMERESFVFPVEMMKLLLPPSFLRKW